MWTHCAVLLWPGRTLKVPVGKLTDGTIFRGFKSARSASPGGVAALAYIIKESVKIAHFRKMTPNFKLGIMWLPDVIYLNTSSRLYCECVYNRHLRIVLDFYLVIPAEVGSIIKIEFVKFKVGGVSQYFISVN
jgi:hypothetical protein